MRIGLVGKPNVGKSTAFSALTENPVDIANYPFTTIDPNIGITWLPLLENCACKDLLYRKQESGRLPVLEKNDMNRGGSICSPNSGSCNSFRRLVPVTLVDVAGLVPGAHKGRGRGNQFLSDLAQCDALIQVIDISGTTDLEGNPVEKGGSNPIDDYKFLLEEMDSWILGIISTGWERTARSAQAEGQKAINNHLSSKLTGIGASESDIATGLSELSREFPSLPDPKSWGKEQLFSLSSAIRKSLFPISVAANKADKNVSEETISELSKIVESEGGVLIPTIAEAELAIRRASLAGLIEYSPEKLDFEIIEGSKGKLSEAQKKALESISEMINKLIGGGLVDLVSQVVFGQLSRIVAYPVQDDTHWIDGDGNPLPDAILVPEGTTARGLAFHVHSDLGEGFIRAIDARSGRVIGAEHELSDGDVISIQAKTS